MKRIGIDIDDTITYTNSFLISEAIKYDTLIGGNGFKDKNAYDFTEMFFWTIDDKKNFFNYLKENELLIKLEIRKDFYDILNELNELTQIYFISSRSEKSFKDAFEQTKNWLEDNGIKYEKLFTNIDNKTDILNEYKIDLFIDDFAINCEDAIKNGINALLMSSDYNKDSTLRRVDNWYQIIEYIRKW